MIIESCVLNNGGRLRNILLNRRSSEKPILQIVSRLFQNKVTIEPVRQAYKPADSVVDVGNGEGICRLQVVMRCVF